MNNYNNKHLIFIVYDGIENSVFQSQVLQPILDDLQKDKNLIATIISFEPDIKNAKNFCQTLVTHINLKIIFFRRLPFFGKLSMLPAIFNFNKFCKTQNFAQINARVTARGPLAGYILLKSNWQKTIFINFIIQARGLCAEEYRYSKQKMHRNFLQKIWDTFIFKNLENIERKVYGNKSIKIEAVSPALQEYLITKFGAESANIMLAVKDIPKSVDKYQAVVWNDQVRDDLGIPNDAVVYCYSGSFRPWQCAKETIEAFSFEYFKCSKTFMLVLTQDIKPFEIELKKFNIPETSYKILTVKPQELYRYLCAADFGMLLREPDVINWVSRPTKMLEYQACGLKIIHNNTVAWLVGS